MTKDSVQVLIDLDALRINCANKDDLVIRLLKLFIQQGSKWSAELTDVFSQGDERKVRETCHRIKGGSATIQAQEVSQAAIVLSDCVKNGKLKDADGENAFNQLLDLIDKSMESAQDLINTTVQ